MSQYRPIPKQFTESGWTLTLRERQGLVCLFERSKPGLNSKHYEVVRLRQLPAAKIMGNEVPAREAMPSNEAWGKDGFTYLTLEEAEQAFESLVNAAEPA